LKNLVVQLARQNSSWGYDRMVGALANLGHSLSDQTVGPSAPAGNSTSTQTESDHYLEGIHPPAHGRLLPSKCSPGEDW
jgi:hypothetical protein